MLHRSDRESRECHSSFRGISGRALAFACFASETESSTDQMGKHTLVSKLRSVANCQLSVEEQQAHRIGSAFADPPMLPVGRSVRVHCIGTIIRYISWS